MTALLSAHVYTAVRDSAPWIEQRRNWLKATNALSPSAWWTNFANTTRSVVPDPLGSGASVIRCVTTGNNGGPTQNVATGNVGAAENMPVGVGTFTARFLGVPGASYRIGVQEYSPAIALRGQALSTVVATGAWQDVVLPYTLTAADSRTRVYVQAVAAGTFHVWGFTAEAGVTPGGMILPGFSPEDPVTRYRWLGAADASMPVMETRETLSLVSGSCTLDARRRPHVQGSVTIAVPSLAVLAALDPRMSPAPRITVYVSATFPWGTQARSFDLALRDRSVNLKAARVELELASDEALMGEFAPLADDATPLQHQDSMHALVGYVLDTVIPGAVLDVTGSAPDVPVPALADSSNLIRNPRAATGTTDWHVTWQSGGLTPLPQASGGPAYAPTYVAHQSAASVVTTNAEIFLDEQAVSITTGKQYVLSVALSGSVGRVLILDAVCFDGSGNITGFIPPVETSMTGYGAWARVVSDPFVAYPNTSRIRVRVRAAALFGGEYVDVTGWRLSEATGDLVADGLYYDGGTTDTAEYDYSWQQAAHSTISNRKVKIDAATPDALIWDAGQDAMTFLAPIVQAAGLRLVCDEQRVWTLRDENYAAGGALEIRHAVNLLDGSDKISRNDEDWFDAAVVVYKWTDRSGTAQQRVDSYALTPSYTRMRRFEFATAYPGPGFAEYAVRRAQGRGREVTVTVVADWAVKAEQSLTAILDGAPPQIGNTNVVRFDFDTDEMTITSRTTDTPFGAIDLLPGTIDSLVGTIDEL